MIWNIVGLAIAVLGSGVLFVWIQISAGLYREISPNPDFSTSMVLHRPTLVLIFLFLLSVFLFGISSHQRDPRLSQMIGKIGLALEVLIGGFYLYGYLLPFLNSNIELVR